MEQIAQRSYGVSLTGDVNEPSGCSPVQCTLGRPCLNWEDGPKVFSKLTHFVNYISHARFLFPSLQPLSHQKGERNRVLPDSSTQHNLLHALTTVHSLQMLGFGMELGFFDWFEFFEGGVHMCVCLYIEC